MLWNSIYLVALWHPMSDSFRKVTWITWPFLIVKLEEIPLSPLHTNEFRSVLKFSLFLSSTKLAWIPN